MQWCCSALSEHAWAPIAAAVPCWMPAAASRPGTFWSNLWSPMLLAEGSDNGVEGMDGVCTAESALSTACRRDEVDGPRAGENHALLLVGDLTSLFVAPLLGLALKVRWEGGVASVARAGPSRPHFVII